MFPRKSYFPFTSLLLTPCSCACVTMLAQLSCRHQAMRAINGLRGGGHHSARFSTISAALPVCDEIVILRNRSCNREVVLVGTVHVLRKSAALARTTIQTVKPDIVMIEMCAGRLRKAGYSASSSMFLHPHVPREPRGTLWTLPSRAFFGVATVVGVRFYFQSLYWICKKLGFTLGGEFTASIEEAQKIKAKVLLGDRDFNKTMRAIAGALHQMGIVGIWKMMTDKTTDTEKIPRSRSGLTHAGREAGRDV